MESETQWRRARKVDIKTKPWISISNKKILLKYIFRDSSYEILITNCIHIWYETLDQVAIRSRTSNLNPNLEAPLWTILRHIEDCLESKEQLEVLEKEDELILKGKYVVSDIPFIWQFYCTKAGEDMISEHLTVPLLIMVVELQRRQSKLFEHLKKKDCEIEDYKSQGITVSRRYMETPLFNEKAFQHEMAVSKEFKETVEKGGYLDDLSPLLYTDVMMKTAWISAEASTEICDPNLQTVEANTVGASWMEDHLPCSLLSFQGQCSSPEKGTKRTIEDNLKSEDLELMRRKQLEQKLQEEEAKKILKKKKKKGLF